MNDARGIEIRNGDIVAYPDRRGAHLWLNIARVVDVNAVRWGYRPERGSDFYPVLRVKADGSEIESDVQRIDRVVVISGRRPVAAAI